VPFDSADSQGIVYVWIGKRSNAEEARLAEEIADDMYGVSYLVHTADDIYRVTQISHR